ncbi:hypothetical protein B5G20_02755 [Collinsella sp. An7]|uniref:ERF family protein n=1 Tax=Collinsella sp. An7 TaxID=1965651 RepID=UPI000B39C6D8|nr:ERF family protein [Collinsella sp. An7]OUN47656.1 hypothetical protein B5G20_02755 [Collinsella sp. An7]
MDETQTYEGLAAELMELLSEAQKEMPNPKKSREGQKGYQKYKYATLDAVLDIVKAPLNERGIFLSQPSGKLDDGTMRVQTVVFYKGTQMVLDTKPYEYDSDPQEFGKRETYARRYSLLTAFGLAGEDDTDGDTGPAKAAPKPASKAAQPKKEQQVPDRRTRMLAKVAKYKATLMERGLSEDGLNAYLTAHYNVDSPDKLTDEQLIDYGKQLAKTVEEYEGKETPNVD